jgi:hypothetical protein
MRPIHRPIHDLAILPEIWDGMSSDEQILARAQGKIRLPVRTKNPFFPPKNLIYFILIERKRIFNYEYTSKNGHTQRFFSHF